MISSDAIVSAFDQAGYRVTQPRRALARLIEARAGHFTAEELLRDSRRSRLGLARATVFRSLETLTELGLIERIDLPSGEHAFVACEAAHHHHVVCSRCGRSTDVGDGGIGQVVAELARRSGYRIDSHRLELFGLCPICQTELERKH
jgi:Fe2+ or Zn2+ uptake regulation protein